MGRGRTAVVSGGGRFMRIVKAPLRMLQSARDLYVRSMTGCAGRLSYPGMVSYPGGVGAGGVPRSFIIGASSRASVSGEDDLRELIRAASQGRMGSLNRQAPPSEDGRLTVPRSQSVAIGRIDEDRPCEFGDDVFAAPGPMCPRSRSYAVGKSRWL